LTEKRNHTWCELGHDSSSGVKEGGTGLLDLDFGDRMHKKKKQIIPALNHRIHTTHNNIFINAKKKSTKIHKMLKLAYVKKINRD